MNKGVAGIVVRLREFPWRAQHVAKPSVLDEAADRIEYLESLTAADEWTLRNVLDELESGKVYDAENAIRIALLTHQDDVTGDAV